MWKKRLALATLLFTVALFILIQTASFQQWLLRRVQNLSSSIGFPFKADKLRLNLFELQASLDGFVYDKDGTRVRVDHLTIDAPWNAVRGDVIKLNTLVADGLTITIQSGEPVLPEPSGKVTQLPKIQIESLNIRNGSLSYSNQSTLVRIPAFNIEANKGRGMVRIASPVTISPDTQVALQDIPIVLGTDTAQFGPLKWDIQYSNHQGSGSATGDLRWSPSVAFHTTFTSEPLTIEKWKDLQTSGKVAYEDGILKLTDVHVVQGGSGQVTASAEISDQGKSANVTWSAVRLDPSGIQGSSDGSLQLKWKASDFSDAAGDGVVDVVTRQYGKAHTGIRVKDGRANLDIAASAMDAAIRANINAGLDRALSGSFTVTQRKYGLVTLNGRIGGTFDNPTGDASVTVRDASYEGVGPVNASAKATLRGKVVTLENLRADLKNSSIPDASLKVDLDSKRIEGNIPQINTDLHDFDPEAQGKAQLTAEIGGTLDHPTAKFSGSSDGIDVGQTHIDNANLAGRFADDTVFLDQLQARQAEGSLEAEGSVNVRTRQIGIDAHAKNIQIVQIHDLSTTVFLDASIGGTTTAPSTDFKGQLQNVVYQGQEHGDIALEGKTEGKTAQVRVVSDKYSASGDAQVGLEQPYPFNATLTANNSAVQYGQYDVVANGKANASGQLQPFETRTLTFDGFTVKGDGIDLKLNGALQSGVQVHAVADLANLPVDNSQMTGTATIDATVGGTVTDPTIEGTLVTDSATVRTVQMAEPAAIKAAVDFNRTEFVIKQMQATMSDAAVTLSGRGTLKGTGEFQFQASNIRPERLIKDRPVAGVIGLEGTISVAKPAVDGLSGIVRVTQFDVSVRDVPLHQVQPIEVAIENQMLTVRNFAIEGMNTRTVVTGNADLRSRALNFNIEGNTDLRVFEAFIPNSTAEGKAEMRVAVQGTTDQPDLNGFIEVRESRIETANPPISLRQLEARVRFSGNRMQIERAAGKLNDGDLAASGGAAISSQGLTDSSIRITLTKVQLEYPEGLQSNLSSDTTLTGSSPNLVLEGTVDINNGSYRENIDFTERLWNRVNAKHQESNSLASQVPSFADQIRLEIQVRVPGLVTVSNNVANLDMTGTFRVAGNASKPIILGRASVMPGGELYFGPGAAAQSSVPGERRDRYVIQRGDVNFNNTLQTEPEFDFEATHELTAKTEGRYLITLRVSGTPDKLVTDFSSDPPDLNEDDIRWMLLTGRTFTELQGSLLPAASEQFANYFSGKVSGFFETAGSALGLDTVRIEPVSLAEEEDLGARLTLAKDITKDFSFIYSQSLAGARSQTWIANYSTYKNLLVRGINDTENQEIRFELKHDLRIGGGPPLPKRIAPQNESVLSNVTFSGSTFSYNELRKHVTKPGKPFNAYRMNEDVRDLKKFLAKNNYLDATIHAQHETKDAKTEVQFNIEQGPKITFGYEGFTPSSDLRKEIQQIWSTGKAEAISLRESTNAVLRDLRNDGYLQAKVEHRDASVGPDERRYMFTATPGRKFQEPEWLFKGIKPVDVPKKAGVVMEKPEAIQKRIEFELQKQGFLDAKSTVPELILAEDRPQFVVTVEQGEQYMVSKIEFAGNNSLPSKRLVSAVREGPTKPPTSDEAGRPPDVEEELKLFPFTSDWVEKAQQRAVAEYWLEGFNDVVVGPSTNIDKATAHVTVHFDVTEGERQMVESIQVEGTELTNRAYVLRQFQFKEGDPVDYTRINFTRKKLYDTQLFKRVDIDMVKGQSANGYIAQVRLNESAPWRFRYGFTMGNHLQTSDRDLGVSTDLSYGNILGKGILLGTSLKSNASLRDGRIYGTMPTFAGRNVRSTLTLFRTHDLTLPESTTDLWGITAQQQWRLKNYYILTYDYSYRWEHTFDRDPNDGTPVENVTIPVARLNGTLSRDTRDDILNATRGSFLSNSFEFAPPALGSSVLFLRNYTQFFHFKQINRNLVWANAIRAGAARAFSGQKLIPSEQFLAGGSTTLRAFKQDQLTLSPGNALFVVNSELRFPLFWKFGAVTFFDAGNVYENVGGLHSFDLRYSPGIGLRLQTPLVLLRVDLGFNLWPRTGEQRRRFAFGIGQAF